MSDAPGFSTTREIVTALVVLAGMGVVLFTVAQAFSEKYGVYYATAFVVIAIGFSVLWLFGEKIDAVMGWDDE